MIKKTIHPNTLDASFIPKLEILAEKEKEEKNKNNNLLDNKELNEETDIFAYFSHNTKKSRNKNNNNDNFTKQPFLNYNCNNKKKKKKNIIHNNSF